LSCDIAGRTDWRQEAESAAWDGFLRLGLDTFSPGPLHFTTRAALQLVSWGRVCCMERLYIYTDGSGGDGAGWAFTVIGELGGDFFICGVAGHTLQGSASASLAVALDSTNAELMAIIWAGLFALTVPDHIGICLCPDSTYAIAAANLELRLASTRVLEHIVEAIITTARQTRRVHTQHVKAHWDAPWNELADCLAKHCRSSSLSVLPANLRGKIFDNAGLQWDWLLRAPPSIANAYPHQHEEGMWGNKAYNIGLAPTPASVNNHKHKSGKKTEFHLNLVTFNCRSLHASGAARTHTRFSQRAALLRDEAANRGVHVMGIQEAGTPKGTATRGDWLVFASGGVKGSLGCELWVYIGPARGFQDNSGNSINDGNTFCKKDFALLHGDPRVLVVACSNRLLTCTFIVAHAPCEPRPADADECRRSAEWWGTLDQHMSPANDPVLLIDANARVGGRITSAIGCGGLCEEESPQGEHLHTTLLMHGLVLPDTLVNKTTATTGGTWKAPRSGKWSRIDYIAVPAPWRATVASTSVAYDWDTHSTSVDHAPVFLYMRRCSSERPRLETWKQKALPKGG